MSDVTVPAFQVVLAGAASLVDDIPIEAGRVRARRLFRGPGGTVMGVAMDAGAVMREHVAPGPILIHVVGGHATLDVDGNTVDLPVGALVHVDTRVPHEVTALEQTRFLLMLANEESPRPGA